MRICIIAAVCFICSTYASIIQQRADKKEVPHFKKEKKASVINRVGWVWIAADITGSN